MRTSKQDICAGSPWLEYQAIFDNAAIGIAFTRNRCILRCNQRWAEMFGYAEDALAGQPASVLYPSQDDYEALGRQARPVLGAGLYFQTDLQLMRRDGTLFWCRLYGRAVDPASPANGTVWITEDITSERQAKQRESEVLRQLEAIFETAVLGLAVMRNRVVERCNSRFEEIMGYGAGELVGRSSRLWYLSDEDFNGPGAAAYQDLAEGRIHRREQIFRRKDGTTFWGRLSGRAFDPADVLNGSVWLLEDVTERKARETRLRNALDEQQMIFRNAAVGIMFVRNRIIQRCNQRLESLFGYPAGALAGRSTAMLYASPDDYQRHGREAYEVLTRDETYSGEVEVRRRDGSTFWVRATAHQTHDDAADASGIGVIWIVDDITERRRMQEALIAAQGDLERRVAERTSELACANIRLQAEVFERMQAEQRVWHIAHHDPLTGLPNRSLLHDRTQQAIIQAQRDGAKVGLMFIDLDRFKQINDTLGHEVGDEFLKGVAARVAGSVRGVDTVSRLGGDEFVVVLQGIRSQDDATCAAEKVLDALRPAVSVGEHALYPSASLGLALYPEDGDDLAALLRAADNAMYHAKSAGRGTYRFFSEAMEDETRAVFALEQQLRQAISAGQFVLHYQPWFAADGQRSCGLEAFLRWQHPTRGVLPAAEFISVAEESGLILALGDWVLDTGCAQLAAWRALGLDVGPLTVNLSAREFARADLVSRIDQALQRHGLSSDALELDLCEAALMQDPEGARAKLAGLAELGVHLAVDDFGSGYSSLVHLRRFPVQRLKIDRSFVADLGADEDDEAIVQAVIGLGEHLGLSVLAEGVETELQAATLHRLGGALMQGNWFAAPMPASELPAFLHAAVVDRRNEARYCLP